MNLVCFSKNCKGEWKGEQTSGGEKKKKTRAHLIGASLSQLCVVGPKVIVPARADWQNLREERDELSECKGDDRKIFRIITFCAFPTR